MSAQIEEAQAAGVRVTAGDRQPLPTTRLVRRAVRDAHR
jgi:hypothetical protein